MTSQSSADNVVSKGDTASPLSRPGISKEYLAQNAVRVIEQVEAKESVGLAADGIQIPYHEFGDPNRPIFDPDGVPYARLRLHNPRGKQRYHSRAGTSVHGYLPYGWADLAGVETLIITEGEFKAMALMDPANRLKVPAIGIPGIFSFRQKDAEHPVLCKEIREALTIVKPEQIIFLGDSDTALNPDFAKAVIKFAGLLEQAVTVSTVTMPYEGEKGVDDTIEVLKGKAASFLDRLWVRAFRVQPSTSHVELATHLFKVQIASIAQKIEQDRLNQLLLLARFSRRFPSEIGRNIIKKHKTELGISLREFDQSVEEYVRNERSAESAELSHFVSGVIYNGESYYVEDRGRYIPMNKQALVQDLIQQGCSRDDAVKVCSIANRDKYAHWVGKIAGYPAGEYGETNNLMLITDGPKYIKPSFTGDATLIVDFLCQFFGKGLDPQWQSQYRIFSMWLQRFLVALENFEQFLPGQIAIFVGPPDIGKDFLQTHLITPLAGGRVFDPWPQWSTGSIFTDAVTSAEHLKISDADCSDERAVWKAKGAMKRFVGDHTTTSHQKYSAPITVKPVSRLTICCNTGPNALQVIPKLSDDMLEKLIIFRCYRPNCLPTGALHTRTAFVESFRRALPVFLGQLRSTDLSGFRVSDRFFAPGYQHPEILCLLREVSRESRVLQFFSDHLNSIASSDAEFSTSDWFSRLNSQFGLTFQNIVSTPEALGLILKALGETPDSDLHFAARTGHVGRQRSKVRLWRVSVKGA